MTGYFTQWIHENNGSKNGVTSVTGVTEAAEARHTKGSSVTPSPIVPENISVTGVTLTPFVTPVTPQPKAPESEYVTGKVIITNTLDNNVTPLHVLHQETSEDVRELTYIPAELEERIAIIQHESGMPEEWAEVFARVECMQRPPSISSARWQEIIDEMGRMLDAYNKKRVESWKQ